MIHLDILYGNHHDVYVRTTLTLDSDVVALLREEVTRTRRPFKQVVNQALRLGLRASAEPEQRQPFRVEPFHDLGFKPGIDPDKLGQLDDELQTEEFTRKYLEDQRRG